MTPARLRARAAADNLGFDADLHLLVDEDPAPFEDLVPHEAVILAVDRGACREPGPLPAPWILRATGVLHVERHRTRDAVNRQIPLHLESACAGGRRTDGC